MEDFVARKRWRCEVDRHHLARQPLHQHAAKHRLAAADLAGDLDDAFIVHHGVGKRFERRAALPAVEKEVGMRRDAKRRLVQPEMLEVQGHALLLLAGVHAAVKRRAVDAEELGRVADVAARQP